MKKDGAGLIPYIDNRDGRILYLTKDILFLCLIKKNNNYDLPKGCLDENEDIKECAKREAYEEVNLKENDYIFISENSYACGKDNKLILFPCILKDDCLDHLKIKINKETNYYEHEDYIFVTKDAAEQNILDYMSGCFKWVSNNFID